MKKNASTPPLRAGAAGLLDRVAGPGATRAELLLQFLPAIAAAVIAPLHAHLSAVGWNVLQYLVCALLAFDIAGGVMTNATYSAHRWYHRRGQGFAQLFGFTAIHLVHLAIVGGLYLTFDWAWIAASGGLLLAGAAIILLAPPYLQRPVAMLVYALALLISLYLLAAPAALEWFLPLFYLKLFVSHLPEHAELREDIPVRS